MFDAIIKTFIPILKKQKYDKSIEKNSLILRLDDIGSNLIKGLMDLYSNYYNPYTGDDELKNRIHHIVDDNLFIFDDIIDDELDFNITERGTDLFDNDWEDYKYEDIVHFCYRKDQEKMNNLNAGFIVVLGNSIYFNFKDANDLQLIIEEEKTKIGTLNIGLVYNKEFNHITSTELPNNRTRRDQILFALNDIIISLIKALKVFELVFLEIRKENKDYTFELDDQNIYDRVDKYFDKDSIYYKWVIDNNRSIYDSKYLDCIEDLESYFMNVDIKVFRDKQKENEDSYLENVDKWLDSVVSTIEGITCSYNNKVTTLIVPPNIKSSIKSIMTYRYSGNRHYSFNVGSTEIINKEDNSIIYFPIMVLMDEESNIVDKSSIKDKNIQKCYNDILNWLKDELLDFGIPIDAIEASINNISSGAMTNVNKNDILNNLSNRGANVIVLDKTMSENMNLNDILHAISNAITGEEDINISDLTLDSPNIKERALPNKSNTINNKKSNSIIKYVEFDNAIQYSEYIEEKMSPYIDSIFIQFYMNYQNVKQIADLFYNFSNMTENEYYNKENIYNDINFSDFFQGDSFIININYKDILLDTVLIWYGQNEDDKFYIGRIFDKINYAVPRTKDWYRSCCKYNTQNGLNLNLCSYTGIANIDLTGLCKYIYDDKFNRRIFEDAVKIHQGKRCKDSRIFEISSYIWSVLSTIFMKKYIYEKKYRGEEQYSEFGYLKTYRKYEKVTEIIDGLSDLIKNNKIDKVTIQSTRYMIDSYINNQSIFKEDENNNELEDSFICINLPNGDRLYCYNLLNNKDVTTAEYYIKKSRKKALNRTYTSTGEFGKFYIIADTFKKQETKDNIELFNESDFIRYNLILIQNILDSEKFIKDLLIIFKYLEYDFDNIYKDIIEE